MQDAAQAEQLLQAGDLTAARARIAEGIANRDDIPELHLLRGRIEFSAGASSSAFDAYVTALSLDNANMEALQAVSQLGLRTGNIRESLNATNQILAIDPSQADALIVRGIHALIRRRFDEAIEYADRLLESEPGSDEGAILKARALFLAGRPTDALTAMKAAEASGHDTVGIALTKLEIFRELRDSASMMVEFEKLRRLRPDDAGLRLDEANLQFKLGKRSAGQALALSVLGSRNIERQQMQQAIRLLWDYGAEGISRTQVDAVQQNASLATMAELARNLLEAERTSEAEPIIRRLPDTTARSLTARLAVLNGKPGEALELAGPVLASDRTQCDALVAFGRAKLLLGNSGDALRKAQLAAAECPTEREAWVLAADAYAARKEPAGVERVFREAIASNPQDLILTRRFVDWLVLHGRERQALAIARRLTRNAPALNGGWADYRRLCVKLGADCVDRAARGLADARTRYWIDLPPGELPPNGLFGRLVRRDA
jgi:tetratricopeptide (TPR) repeat protein